MVVFRLIATLAIGLCWVEIMSIAVASNDWQDAVAFVVFSGTMIFCVGQIWRMWD